MAIADLYDHFLFDLDGCIYLEDRVIPPAPPTLAELRRRGKKLLFVTNGSFNSREVYAAKLRKMGISATVDEVLNAPWVCARYLKQHHDLLGKTAYVVGSAAFKEEARAVGLRLLDGEESRRADFVLVGAHVDFNYREIVRANFALQNGALFYSTNRDVAYPSHEGLKPGTGALLASIEAASGCRAISTGKPEPGMMEVALSLLGPGRTLMVGDRLNSDIAGAKQLGIPGALVLTGIATREDAARSEWLPNYVLEDVGELLR